MIPRGLSTDLYELTMMAGYYACRRTGAATFELFVRRLPDDRAFLIAAGLEQALDHLESLRFTGEEIEYLRTTPALQGAPAGFFDQYLRDFRFTGEVWAVEEGTPVFALEPLLRVTGPLPEAQMVETALLSIVTFQTAVASKAIRVVEAAAGRAVIEFGARRAHGLDAALHAARAAYLAGCDGTSYVEAGFRFGTPLSGTMAHSWVLAFPNETDAFEKFSALFGDRAVFLLDTYNTLDAAQRLAASGLRPTAVRLDSGDLAALSRRVRQILDAGGLSRTRIFVSGDLDERRIEDLIASGAPVDGFGVGAAITTSSDAPSLGGVYKLVEVERDREMVGVMKLSAEKQTYPGRKQIWRVSRRGRAIRDVIALDDEPGPDAARPLLRRVMSGGRRLVQRERLDQIRARCRAAVAELPDAGRRLRSPARFPVDHSDGLRALIDRTSVGAP